MEEIVQNELDPRNKHLLYVEKGCSHKELDPRRFDRLRYLPRPREEVIDVPFEEIMEKAEYLLKDPYLWIRWRDITTH